MNPLNVIAISSLLISVLTFLALQVGQRQKASNTYVQSLEKRIEMLERELETAKDHIYDLESENAKQLKENIELYRQLVMAKNNNGKTS